MSTLAAGAAVSVRVISRSPGASSITAIDSRAVSALFGYHSINGGHWAFRMETRLQKPNLASPERDHIKCCGFFIHFGLLKTKQ